MNASSRSVTEKSNEARSETGREVRGTKTPDLNVGSPRDQPVIATRAEDGDAARNLQTHSCRSCLGSTSISRRSRDDVLSLRDHIRVDGAEGAQGSSTCWLASTNSSLC